jgi:YD repeat-containing protein
MGNPQSQYVSTQEHIVGGASPLDHYSFALFDGLGRTYSVQGTTADPQRRIVVDTQYDHLGRVAARSNPYYSGQTGYDTFYAYDGFSRVADVAIPYNNNGSVDYHHILTGYYGLKRTATDQKNHTTTSTSDVFGRLKTVADAKGTLTQYTYDTLGRLTQVTAAQGKAEQNTTTMTYNSLGQKRSMTEPDMGTWTYDYDKAGSLISQTDAKGQRITFTYDGLNRLTQRTYQSAPVRTVTYTYDDPEIPYAQGKLISVSDPSGGESKQDQVLEFDLMQRVTKSQKTIGVT